MTATDYCFVYVSACRVVAPGVEFWVRAEFRCCYVKSPALKLYSVTLFCFYHQAEFSVIPKCDESSPRTEYQTI